MTIDTDLKNETELFLRDMRVFYGRLALELLETGKIGGRGCWLFNREAMTGSIQDILRYCDTALEALRKSDSLAVADFLKGMGEVRMILRPKFVESFIVGAWHPIRIAANNLEATTIRMQYIEVRLREAVEEGV